MQDFRKLKVLPSDLDQFNNVEPILDEFYIKRDKNNEMFDTDVSVINRPQVITSTNSLPTLASSIEPTFSIKQTRSPLEVDTNNLIKLLNVTKHSMSSSSGSSGTSTQDYEIIIREGKETITIYPETITKLLNSFSTIQSSTRASIKVVSPVVLGTTKQPVWKEELMKKYPNVFETTVTLNQTDSDNETKEEIDFLKKISDSLDYDSPITTELPLWEDIDLNVLPENLLELNQDVETVTQKENDESYEDYYDNSGETKPNRGIGVYSR